MDLLETMMKRAYLAAVLGLTIALPALAQDKPLQVDGPTEMERNMVRMWSRENIDEGAYTYFSFGADHTIYWMAADGPGKRVFIRNEYFENQNGAAKPYRSTKSLYGLDCGGKSWRVLATDLFENNGLRGADAHAESPDAAWIKPADGSDDAYLLGMICKG
jgi:hypothetical protein